MKNRKYKPLIINEKEEITSIVIQGFNNENQKIIKESIKVFDSDLVIKNKIEDSDIALLIVPSNYSFNFKTFSKAPLIIYNIDIDYLNYTEAQKKLNASDWEIIKELEKLLPEDNPLRIERDQLRAEVSQEIYNLINPAVDSDTNSSAP